jgi:hypothetical protein
MECLLLGWGAGFLVVCARNWLLDLAAGTYVATVEVAGVAAGRTKKRWRRAVDEASQRRERRWARRGISGERVAAARAEGQEVLAEVRERIRERRRL